MNRDDAERQRYNAPLGPVKAASLVSFALALLVTACTTSTSVLPELEQSDATVEQDAELAELDLTEDEALQPELDVEPEQDQDLADELESDDPSPDQDVEQVEEIDLGPCGAGERVCGIACCASTEVCGLNERCCARESLCGPECCEAGEVCEGATCHLDCGSLLRCGNGSGAEECCRSGELCVAGLCFEPRTSCNDFIDCPTQQYCETSLNVCLPQPTGESCQELPVGGEVLPTLLWAWDGSGAQLPEYNQVMMTPMVARVDGDEIPDVVFISFCGVAGQGCTFGNYGTDGILRVISGADGSSVFDITDPAYRTVPGGQVAIGDIDRDGHVEIVACAPIPAEGRWDVIAFNHDGSFLWRSTDPRVFCTQAAPAIADLDADGYPEVIVRNTVLNGNDGSLKWHHDCVGSGGWASTSHSPCDYNTVADLDGDGMLEVVGGNRAFRHDGSLYYDRSADFLDGYPAIGDLDLDGRPEVVVVHSAFYPIPYAGDHFLRALNWDGSDRWGPVDINMGRAPAADLSINYVGGGGPATIANMDDDPEPEVALAGAYGYAVFEPDGSEKWFAGSYDRSSRKTGSSVFDFDGDGIAEAVYADHYWLRVYDGRDGTVRFCECNTSATLWEYPVIVDVNNDGSAEIVVSSNDYAFSACPSTMPLDWGLDDCVSARMAEGATSGSHGVRVFASPNRDWVNTRPIWNQHTYHVTNVADDGRIPAITPSNWLNPYLNNFRQNVQPGATNLPDVALTDLGVDLRQCPARQTVFFRLLNQGWAAVSPGVPVTVYVKRGGVDQRVGTVHSTRMLLAGESELLSIEVALLPAEAMTELSYVVIVNDPSAEPLQSLNECRPDNNEGVVSGQCLFN